VAVAHGRVGHQDPLFGPRIQSANPFGPSSSSRCRVPSTTGMSTCGTRGAAASAAEWTSLGLGMAVDRHIGEIGQKLGGAVLPLDLLEQFRRRVDEPVV
jgi:hypothetical protein